MPNGGLLRGLYIDIKSRGVGEATAGLQAVDSAGDKASRSLSDVEKGADRANKRMSALKKTAVASGAAFVGIAAGIGTLVRRYGDVDEVFARIQARGQLSNETMQRMRETGNQLGAELPSTLADSANAMDELQRSGFSAQQTMDSLRGTTLLAIAGQLSMQEAAHVTTSVLNAWQIQASRANSVADTLASTASTTSADVRGLGDALSYASSTAAQVGATSEEITAWSGILSNAGQSGTRAGTAIRQALTRIIDPTAEAKDALDSVGLSVQDFYDESGNLRDIESIVSMLNSSMSDLDSHERSQLLNQIFGIRGQSAIAPLLDQSEQLSETLNTGFAASIAGAIDRLNKLNDTDLKPIRQTVGFDLQQGSMRDILGQFRQQAKQQDWSQAELAQRLSEGLDVSHEAAVRLAVDVGGDTEMSQIVDTLDSASTSGEQADAVMDALSGRIERLSGSMDAFFANVYRGVAGPMSMLLGIINPIASTLSKNRTAAQVLGVAMVVLAGATGAVATAAGLALAHTYALRGAQLASEGSTLALSAAQKALSLSYWRAQGAAVASRASTVGLTAARYAGRAAAFGSVVAQNALSVSYWETQAAAVASRAGSLGLAAARSAGRVAALASAGGTWALTAARESSLATTLAARGAQVGLTAARYAGQASAYAAATGTWALDAAITASIPSLAGMAAGLYGAAAGAWALLAPFAPIIAVGAVLVGLFLAWQNNLFGLHDATDAVAALLVGPFQTGVAMAAGAVDAFLHPIDTVQSLLRGLPGAASAARAAFMAIPGIGLLRWLFDLAGGMDTVHAGVAALGTGFRIATAPIQAFLHPIDTVRGVLRWLSGFDASSIPLIGGALDTGPAATAIHAVLSPLTLLHDTLSALSNLDVSDIPLIGGMLSQGIDAGKGLAEGFAQGAEGKKGVLGKAAGGLAGVAAKYLPGSDAEQGPLSTLTQQGGALPQTLAAGMRGNENVVGAAANRLAGQATDALPGAQQARSKVGAFTNVIDGLLGQLGLNVPAPTVGQPQTPRPTSAQAPGIPAPGVGQPDVPQPGSLTPDRQPRTVVEGVAQQTTPAAHTPSEQPQTTVDALATRTAAGDHTPEENPQTAVHGEARAPAPQALTPDTPPTVIDAAVGALPSPGDLLPTDRIQATIEGVAGDLGLGGELATAESGAARIAGTLQSGAQSMAATVAGARPPGMDATIGVGDAPGPVPVESPVAQAPAPTQPSAPPAPTEETVGDAAARIVPREPAPQRAPLPEAEPAAPQPQPQPVPEPRTVGEVAVETTVEPQRPIAPPTPAGPATPVQAPGGLGGSGQPATVGAATARAVAPQPTVETAGPGIEDGRAMAAEAVAPPRPGVADPIPMPESPAPTQPDGRESRPLAPQPTPTPVPTTTPGGAGDTAGGGDAGAGFTITTETNIEQHFDGGSGGGSDTGGGSGPSRQEARRIAHEAGQRAGREAAQQAEQNVFARLTDAARAQTDDQGPGTTPG